MNSSSAAPEIIAIAGVDGSGKTTLTDWLQEELRARGHAPGFVWSRFNNYLSLPFLAATRVTGHNIYRDHEGVRMGFHDFEALPKPLRYMFVKMLLIYNTCCLNTNFSAMKRCSTVLVCAQF